MDYLCASLTLLLKSFNFVTKIHKDANFLTDFFNMYL